MKLQAGEKFDTIQTSVCREITTNFKATNSECEYSTKTNKIWL